MDPYGIEVIPMELAGRGSRHSEPPYADFDSLVRDLYEKIQLNSDTYALFGHSMGGLIVYELYKRLKQQNARLPRVLYISGRNTPDTNCDSCNMHLLSDEELRTTILNYGGTDPEILNNEKLFDFFLPIIRSDYRILDTYDFDQGVEKLTVPLVLLNGDQDDEALDDNHRWKLYAADRCEYHYFKGNHFYINEHVKSIGEVIRKTVDRYALSA